MDFFGWVLAALALMCVGLALLRLFTVRSQGTTVLIRTLPAQGENGWRHGILKYSGDTLKFFKLRSILPKSDLDFDRRLTHVESHRPPQDNELSFMPEVSRVLHIVSDGSEYEISAERRGAMGLVSWIESAPDVRQEKTDHRALTQRIGRSKQHR